MSNTPYGHIGYFQRDESDDDEDIPINSRAPKDDDVDSVGSGILRIKKKAKQVESVFSSRNIQGKSSFTQQDDEEERNSDATHESANVGVLRKELEDADRIHALSLKDYLKVLDVKPKGSGSRLGSNAAVPVENLTWNDLMKASASRSASLVGSDEPYYHDDTEKVPPPPPPLENRHLFLHRKRVAWIVLLCLFVIGIIVAVVLSTGESVPIVEKELSITGVVDGPDETSVDNDFTPNVSLMPIEAPSISDATTLPASPKGTILFPPSQAPTKEPSHRPTREPTKGPTNTPTRAPTKVPTNPPTKVPTKGPTNPPTKAPIPIPTQTPSRSPTLRPVPSVSSAWRAHVIFFLEQDYGVNFEVSRNLAAVDTLLSEGVTALNHKLAQRFALLVLDSSLRNLSEGSWNANKWITLYVDECQWDGVTCDQDGFVSELRLGSRSYGGTIPSEIRILQRSLKYLDLAKNDIVGTIPEDFFQLTLIERVYLHHNKLSGGISASLAFLPNLTHLHMSNNLFSGSIPNDFRRMTNLRYLNLYQNQISGHLPRYMKYMSSLWFLDLGRNQIDGYLPGDWGDGLESLKLLYLDHNKIDKYIPQSYNNLGNLQVLSLNDNYLTGSVPLNNPKLVTLNVHNNRLTSKLGTDVCAMTIFGSGKMVDFTADCDICDCKGYLCGQCSE